MTPEYIPIKVLPPTMSHGDSKNCADAYITFPMMYFGVINNNNNDGF